MDNYVEHVVEHYLARDRWRMAMAEYLGRNGHRHLGWDEHVPSPSHYHNNGSHYQYQDYVLDKAAVHKTRESLKRVKEATVEHLHDLLHKEEVLSDERHVHQGGDIFHFLIHEADDLPNLRDLL